MRILDDIKDKKIYGIIREDDPEAAYELARAYAEGGIKFIELNCSLEVTEKVSKLDNVVVSQGGIVTTDQAHLALKAGATIISSPIFQMNLVRFASCYSVFLIPSVTTPNEAYCAWRARMPLIKLYPVKEMGGLEYFKDLIKPMPFLNLLPCGFVKLEDVKGYLNAGAIAVGIGRELYSKNSYSETVETVKELMKSIK